MTLPAASGPLWPSVRTTRVDATLSERRNNVVTNRTVGNAKKSSGLEVWRPINSTMMESAILNVNRISNAIAGKGKIIIDNKSTMINGPASNLVFSFSVHALNAILLMQLYPRY